MYTYYHDACMGWHRKLSARGTIIYQDLTMVKYHAYDCTEAKTMMFCNLVAIRSYFELEAIYYIALYI